MRTALVRLILVSGVALLAACGPSAFDDSAGGRHKEDNTFDNNPPLSPLSEVLPNGIPENPAPPPTDDDPPAKGYFLINETGKEPLQSAVKSQGSRGVCTIFAAAAYMEHLYLKARTQDAVLAQRIPAGFDVSEQYLQWSVKFEVKSFPNTSGSNAVYNLGSISDYGVVAESVWPYETSQWGTGNDPKCDGKDTQPTYCYTNGEPTAEMKAAAKYKLPEAKDLSAGAIKQHIYENELAVVIGVKFFYQAWNHGRSTLVTNRTYWQKGYVLYPNADDEADSSGDRSAGHGILIVGWDDELEVAIVDKDGKGICDDAAETRIDLTSPTCPAGSKVKTEKGFYLFKNSWGTGSFGLNSGIGDGYGFIAQRYVHEFGDAMVTGVPTRAMVPDPAIPVVNPIEKKQTFTGSVGKDEQKVFELALGASAKDIKVAMTGATGDADLYTAFGKQPTLETYECRPYLGGSEETCTHATAKDAKLYLMVVGYEDASSPFSVEVTWKE